MGSGAAVHRSLAQEVEAETAAADTGTADIGAAVGDGGATGYDDARPHSTGIMGGIDGVQARTWCFPPRESVSGSVVDDNFLPATHQLLYHRRCLYVIAVDLVGAGLGQTVLVEDEGNSARQLLSAKDGPIRSVIIGIVDDIHLSEE